MLRNCNLYFCQTTHKVAVGAVSFPRSSWNISLTGTGNSPAFGHGWTAASCFTLLLFQTTSEKPDGTYSNQLSVHRTDGALCTPLTPNYDSFTYAVLEAVLEPGKIAEPLLWVIQHFPKCPLSHYLRTTPIWLGSIQGTGYSFSTGDQPQLRLSGTENISSIVSNIIFTILSFL